MKMQWKQVSSITTSQRHLGSHRVEPTENLHPGDVYQNKVTGYTYEWAIVEEKPPKELADKGLIAPLVVEKESVVYDFSRTPNSEPNPFNGSAGRFKIDTSKTDNGWHERGELPPPVGTVCEVTHDGMHGEWEAIEILKRDLDYSYDIDRGRVACISLNGTKNVTPKRVAGELFWLFNVKDSDRTFRPLKSERERAIDQMYALLEPHTLLSYKDICEMLYDAGFRKEGK